jgi:hypothetical protein
MCRVAAVLVMWMALAFTTAAQVPDAGSQGGSLTQADGARPANLRANTMIQAELTKAVDTRKAKPGDPVTAKVVNDVSSGGGVAIPRGAKLMGHVVAAQPYSRGSSQSSLTLVFDLAVLKHNQEMPLRLVIQALAPATRNPSVAATDEGDVAAETRGMGPGGGLAPPMNGAGDALGHAAGSNRDPGPIGGSASAADGMAVSVAPVDVGGHLSTRATGALGLGGISLTPSQDATQGSVLTSSKGNVRLDSGTQLVLRVVQ